MIICMLAIFSSRALPILQDICELSILCNLVTLCVCLFCVIVCHIKSTHFIECHVGSFKMGKADGNNMIMHGC